jgi:diguanylate cyclase (GGDEF)-like protein/PAS domain S-box-containing protein
MEIEARLSDVLSEFARTLATEYPIEAVLDLLVGRIADLLPVSAAGTTVISPGERRRYVAASDDSALRLERQQMELGEGPWQTAYASGEVVSVVDLRADDRFPDFGPRALEAGIEAIFSFPLVGGHTQLGALDLYRVTAGPLDPEAMVVAQKLVDVAAAYVVNAGARADLRVSSEVAIRSSLHDQLTGLANRSLLLERLEHALLTCRRSGKIVAVLFTDLDLFKSINDTHGHHVGDELLVAIADRLSATVRPGDTLARLGGDEFVVLCVDLDEESQADPLAARIDAAFADPFVLTDVEVRLAASVGIAFAGRGDDLAEQVIKDADYAMYQVKRRMTKHRISLNLDQQGGLARGDLRSGNGIRRGRAASVTEWLAAIVSSLDDAIIGYDLDGVVLSWNDGAERLYGYSAAEMIGSRLSRVLPSGLDSELPEILAKITRGQRVERYERKRYTKDGRIVDVSAVVSPVRAADGTIVGASAVAHDVTDERKAIQMLTRSERWSRLLLDRGSDLIIVGTHVRGEVRYVSPSVARLLGYSPDEFSDQATFAVHPDDLPRLDELVRTLKPHPGARSGSMLVRFVHRDGSPRYFDIVLSNLLDDPDVGGMILNGRDVTSERETAQTLAAATRIAQFAGTVSRVVAAGGPPELMLGGCADAAVEHLDVSAARIWTLSNDGEALELQVSSGITQIDGGRARIPVGHLDLGVIEQDHEPRLSSEVVDELRCGHQEWAEHEGVVAFAACPLVVDDALVGVMAVYARQPIGQVAFEAMTSAAHEMAGGLARKRDQESFTYQSSHDSLTGLANRSLVVARIAQMLAWTDRTRTSVAVVFIGMDRFNEINASRGHETANAVLVETGERLESAAGPTDLVGRFGGDQFVVITEVDPTDDLAPVRLARQLLDSVRLPIEFLGHRLFVTASAGIATARTGSADRLLQNADSAMHEAKQHGRDRIELFDEAAGRRVRARLSNEDDLRNALTEGELVVHYQPVVSLTNGHIVAAEALVRWNHPRHGLLLPGNFIPLAEESGLIEILGGWVLEQACSDAAGWPRSVGFDLRVSVNVSAIQLSAPGIAAVVERALQTSGLAAERLTLEITESALIDDIDASIKTLASLKHLGIHIALDDFGTGYSSLSYLRRLPIDEFKIDKSFIDALGTTARDSAIVAAIMAMGRALDCVVTAEGVERPEQLAALRAVACDQGQGYLFAKALAQDSFTEVVRAGRGW